MLTNGKYPRSFHSDFSPGTTSDDRINYEWRTDFQQFETAVHTEKLDGQNNRIGYSGVFARSHGAPSSHPWDDHLKPLHAMLKEDLKTNDMELFGENMYAEHSIIYPKLEHYYYVFGIRILDKWLSWEETKWYTSFFDLPTVPELSFQSTKDPELVKQEILRLSKESSVFGSLQNEFSLKDLLDGAPLKECTREGIVTRNIEEYHVDDFSTNLMKFVRKDHVRTDAHWTKNWQRAKLIHEFR